MNLSFNMINELKHTPIVHLACPPPPRTLSHSKGFKDLASRFSSHIMRLDFLCELLFTCIVKYYSNMEVLYEV